MRLDRRRFLSGSASGVAMAAIGAGTFTGSLLGSATEADAEIITAALAIGAAVAGAVAAANASDGGLGGYLIALNGKLDAVLGKLEGIQGSIIQMTSMLSQFPKQIRDELILNNTRQYQADLRTASEAYRSFVSRRPAHMSEFEWAREDELGKGEIADIHKMMIRNTSYGISNAQCDPLTMYSAIIYIYAELSTMVLRGYHPDSIRTAINNHVGWLDMSVRVGNGSSVDVLKQSKKNHDRLLTELDGNIATKSLNKETGVGSGTWRCAGINDEDLTRTKTIDPDPGGVRVGPDRLPRPSYEVPDHRYGVKDRLWADFTVTSAEAIHVDPVSGEAVALGFPLLQVVAGAEQRADRTAQADTLSCDWAIKSVNLEDAGARYTQMVASASWQKGPATLAWIQQQIDNINYERGRMMIAANAIQAVGRCRTQIIEFGEFL